MIAGALERARRRSRSPTSSSCSSATPRARDARRAELVATAAATRVSWVLAFAGFAVLIILHEAGHFTAAKAVGMRVERFFLFFPPKLWSVKRGETEYGIGAIPLGGFVKITGMNPEEELDPEVAPARLLQPAGLEADRRDRGGPVREPRDRVRDPLLPRLRRSSEPTNAVGERSSRARRPRRILEPGDRLIVDRRRQRGAGTSDEQPSGSPTRSAARSAPASRPTAAGPTTPVPVVVDARRRAR